MLRETVLYLLSAAVLQNLVLHTGFGASVLLRTARRDKDTLFFLLTLTLFSLCTVLAMFPLDNLLGSSWSVKVFRPVLAVAVTSVLYLVACLILKKGFPHLYVRYAHSLPAAAFNNLVVAVALIINHQLPMQLLPALGFALGSCLGFCLLTACVRFCIDRTDHEDLPEAFRGLPIHMLFLGILALAFMGFSAPYNF